MGILADILTALLYITYDRKGGPGEFRVINDAVQVSRSDIYTGTYVVDGLYDINNAIRFRLWTRENPILAHEIIVHDRRSYRTSNYDPKRVTKIFVHGKDHRSNEQRLDPETVYMRDAYLRFADVNFVLLDWTHLAHRQRFFTNYGDFVSKRLAQFIRFLERQGTPLSAIHLIGLSWGAHVCGEAGSLLGGKVSRITGLDPAGPLYTGRPSQYILEKSDAQFVDIIHTDAGGFRGIHSGIQEPTGHADFYPNGGDRQPGCPPVAPAFYKDVPCSHERSVDLFTESIGSPLSFPSCMADSWQDYLSQSNCTTQNTTFMGEHLPAKTRGVFYLTTRGSRPFGTGKIMDVILPSIVGGRPSRNYIFNIRGFRLMQSNNVKEYRTSMRSNDQYITVTESNYSPSNQSNIKFYPSAKPYLPRTYPNNEVLLYSLQQALTDFDSDNETEGLKSSNSVRSN